MVRVHPGVNYLRGGMVDALDSKFNAFGRVGSSPIASRIKCGVLAL